MPLAVACAHKPPPDFAPDPGLVARIQAIRIMPQAQVACPGQQIRAEYEAVLDDGRTMPFERKYDKNRPPALHVVFLRRWSSEADAQEDGDWSTDPDPLASAMGGFHLNAELLANPAIHAEVAVEPEYSCVPRGFRFEGRPGGTGETGSPGPNVLVRVNLLRSPFYDRLLVAGIQVGEAPPFYVLYDADAVPPSDWLVVASAGGRGGRGVEGERGAKGTTGQAGCPGTRGGTGGPGGPGGPGASGGSGGPITVIAPSEQPFLAGIVDGRSVGGGGGSGGRGGKGGPGGDGGPGIVQSGRRCATGPAGETGEAGESGPDGPPGTPGSRPRIITVSEPDVYGARVPQGLADLIDYSRN